MDPDLQCEWDFFVKAYHDSSLPFVNSITRSIDKLLLTEILNTTTNEVIMISTENNVNMNEEEMTIYYCCW